MFHNCVDLYMHVSSYFPTTSIRTGVGQTTEKILVLEEFSVGPGIGSWNRETWGPGQWRF